MVEIHPSAIVHPKAELGKNVTVGPFSIIEDDVMIGDGCKIHSNVLIAAGARIGAGVEISNGAVLSTEPQDLKYRNEKTYLEVGDNTKIREFVTLNRGTAENYKTVVGENCLIMTYAHVAHDCVIGNHVIIANSVQMGGHVVIGDYAGIGGLTAIHQFVHIGEHSYVGGAFRATKDVPPYVLAMREPLCFAGTNYVGLKRKGFSEETIREIKRAYRLIYQSKLPLKTALKKIESDLRPIPEILEILRFVREAERGLIPRFSRGA